ncbi:MAG: hypothetical protein WDW36_000185 [Sanguina aurantia]
MSSSSDQTKEHATDVHAQEDTGGTLSPHGETLKASDVEYVNLTKNDVVAPSLNTMVDEHKLVADPQDTGGN